MTPWHVENSDVLPFASVAVPVTVAPPLVTLAVNETFPVTPVVTFVEPRNVCPSPLPDASHAALPKNSSRNVLFGVLLSVP